FTTYGIAADNTLNYLFNAMTFLIAVPSGIKTFNWILTMYGGRIKFEAPLLFPLGFIIGFLIGGITGVFVNIVPFDIVVHDTYYVVGHFHYIIIGGAISTIFGAMYYMFPKWTNKMYSKKTAIIHFFVWTAGFILSFGSMLILGLLGMPRRYYDYSNFGNVDVLTFWNQMATLGMVLMGIAFVIFMLNIIYGFLRGKPAGEDPFGIGEWDRLVNIEELSEKEQ
ncbi:MAG: cbb3-type cytochrome c oxidase subunit I, partial [Candidatus Hodarchaeales archaeon]